MNNIQLGLLFILIWCPVIALFCFYNKKESLGWQRVGLVASIFSILLGYVINYFIPNMFYPKFCWLWGIPALVNWNRMNKICAKEVEKNEVYENN